MNQLVNKTKFVACTLIILECLIFGIAFIAVKQLLQKSIPPFLLLAMRFFIGAATLLICGLLLRRLKKLGALLGKINSFKRCEMLGGMISGAILFVAFSLQTIGADYTTPAKNSLFTEMFVIIVPIVNMIIRKKFSAKPLVAAIITFMGVTLVLNIYSDNSNFNIGDVLTIGCGVMFAIQFIVLDKLVNDRQDNDKINAFNFTFIQLLTVAILSVVTSLIFERQKLIHIEWTCDLILWLVYLGVCATALAYLLQFFAQERISPELTSVLSCSDSVFTLIFSIVMGFDVFSWTLVGGGLIMILGMILAIVQFKRIRRNKDNEEKKQEDK